MQQNSQKKGYWLGHVIFDLVVYDVEMGQGCPTGVL